MRFRNLVLIGTSHIAKESLEDVKRAVEKEKPDIIALELDRNRLAGLMHKKERKITLSDIRKVGFKGYIFSVIGAWAEKKLGEHVGVSPGSEMMVAVNLARKHKIKIALVDQDIYITLKKLSDSITWREKWNFLWDILKGVFIRKKQLPFDLSKVPARQVIKKLTAEVKQKYPNVYRILVIERNKFMAERIAWLISKNPDKKIIAIVGAGHEEEIMGIVKKKLADSPHYSYSWSFHPD